MSAINKAWHAKHRMPENATYDQRIVWHAAHAAHCGCRAMPPKIAAEVKKRGAKRVASRAKRAAPTRRGGNAKSA